MFKNLRESAASAESAGKPSFSGKPGGFPSRTLKACTQPSASQAATPSKSKPILNLNLKTKATMIKSCAYHRSTPKWFIDTTTY
jgi:hypothetical protein